MLTTSICTSHRTDRSTDEESELTGNKGMALKIDLSGLTPHEIAKIQQVMLRANQASKLINEQASKIKEDFESLKSQVESAQKAVVSTTYKPNQKRSLCEICFRVDLNITFCHCCTGCQRKFCSRCGHRTLTSFQAASPSQWLCTLCYHERKYLSISGAWMSKTQATNKTQWQRRLTVRRHTLNDLLGKRSSIDTTSAESTSKPLSYGEIEVQFGYVAAQSSLVFTIIRAHDLQYREGRDKKSHINPYCKVYLLPNRQDKRRTCTQTDTTDPVWNRSFMFENVTSKMLKLCSLEISVWSHRGHMRSRKFLGQVTIPLSSVQFNDQPSCLSLEYPDSSHQMSPPSPAPWRLSTSVHDKPDSSCTSTVPTQFSYSKPDVMRHARYSCTSFDSGDSAEEELSKIYASRSYDTGLDELGVSHSRKAPVVDTNTADSQSGRSYPEEQDGIVSLKTSQFNTQHKAISLAKKFLMKKGDIEENADALVAEYLKQKGKQEARRQSKEQEVGEIIRATQSRTSSPTSQVTYSSGATSRPGRSASLTSPIPSVEIDECMISERMSQQSSMSSLLHVQQSDSTRRHSSPIINPPTIQALRGISPGKPRAFSHYVESLPAKFRDLFRLSPMPGVRLASAPGSSDDDTSMISSSSAAVSASAGRTMLGLGVGQLLRSNHIGSNATGRIHLGFSIQKEQLNVYVLAAADLSYHPEDVAGDRITAPYVKLYLLNGRKPMTGEKERRTKEATTYTNPSFNETITFHFSDVVTKTLKVKVKYEPRKCFRRHSKEVGQALVSLDRMDLSDEPLMEWYKLFPTR
ncbi:regulating synaptic membrane exocytosis protein 2-like isoform X2 [Corticium candelabrum]|uniref:regulating synaptic membrane exocytosis protein 2-like isoform X2 n=1 Tax=Corticium candelabrum TaxID=121492 RepID=UPI002E264322|nr:regulating synaptic membrane exocytosis protein 2-like isoform X2 [Corticium candelabrum]